MVTERHDRGQLILITAIAVAFILLAIVIVFNGLLFTQTIASEDASKATTDVKTSERELERGVQGIVQRRNLDEDTGLDEMNDSIEEFASEYRDATATNKPAIVNVSITDYESAELDQDNISSGESMRIENNVGYLLLSPDSGSPTVTMNVSAGGSYSECDVNVDNPVDLVTGANANGCVLPDPGDEYDRVLIESEGGDVTYDLVEKDDGGDEVWSVDVAYTYDSSGVTYDRTFTVEIYEGVPDHAWPEGDDT